MKQKRKVKSLISQKMGWSESLLTTLLLILSVILCIGSASLMTTSVGAADDDQHFEFAYTGLDNKSEVLYRMNFIDPNNLSNVRNTMYMSGKTLYIAPYPVMVNPKNPETNEISTARNEIIGTEKSNILGGDNNKINYSDNITIIAGDGNVIRSGYSNSVVIGGKDNSLNSGVYNNYKQMNSVFIGGDNNKSQNYGNVTLIGGNNNDNPSMNSFILGGSGHSAHSPNTILGGKNVKTEFSNSFAFSYKGNAWDDWFELHGSNAFYLNLENGVGLGVDGSRGGLAVSGAVYFGEIDIRTIRCNTGANIGLKGSYSGCLVGCTKGGFDDGGKWEMLDRGEKCTEICNDNSSYCTNKTEELVPVDEYIAFCTTGVANTGNAVLCYSGEIEKYMNVVFETSLIDSNENCMDFGTENKCLYKCKEGFHLTGDIAGGGHGTRTGCYQDCVLPWNEYETIKHNETVIGYKNKNVSCAYDEDTPHSVDTCDNYKATLVCSGGTLYLANANGTAQNRKAIDEGYEYEKCELNSYECRVNAAAYYLSEEDVIRGESRQGYTETLPASWNWRVRDRETVAGTRGQYKLCVDFDTRPAPGPVENGTGCDAAVPHYKLIRCNNGYATGFGYENECRKTCTSPIDGKIKKDGETIGGYLNGSFVCPHSCDEEMVLTCHDGQWKDENGNTANTISDTCTVSDQPCAGYDVSYIIYSIYNHETGEYPTSIYESCEKYTTSADHQQCIEEDTFYKLVDCVDGYHIEYGYNYCVPNERAGLCSSYVSMPNHHAHWKYEGGTFNREWNGTSRVMSPEDACDWECDDGYDKETTDQEGGYVCVSKPECGSNPNQCIGENRTTTGETNDGKGNYYWICIGDYEGDNIGYSNNGEGGETYTYGGTGLEVSCHACSSSYTWDGLNNRCIKKENGTCLATHYNCKSMDGYATGIVDSKSSAHEDKYTWDCKANYATGITAHCQECRYNLTGNDCHPLTQQVDCPSDKPDHSYWRYLEDGGTYTQTWTKGTTRDYWSHGYWSPNYLTNHVSQYASSYNECSFTCIWYDGYEYNSSTKKCVKCTGLPDNATPNNNKLPDDVTEYYFSNDTSAPCTFKCDTYYTWENGNCEPNEYACTNKPTGSGYKFGSGMYLYGDTLTEWTYTDNSTPGTCQYTCDTANGYSWNGSDCVLGTYTCGGTKPTGTKYTLGTTTYTYGYTPNTWTRVNDTATVGACQYKCNTSAGYGWNGSDCVLIACGGTKPTGNGYIFTLKNPVNVADMKNWTHMTDGTSQSSLNACEYTCDLNSSYYYNGSICKYNNSWCNNDNVNGCQSPATPKNENSSDSTKYTWDCAINGVIMEAGCFKCKEGYTLHNGACVQELPACVSTYEWVCTNDSLAADLVCSDSCHEYCVTGLIASDEKCGTKPSKTKCKNRELPACTDTSSEPSLTCSAGCVKLDDGENPPICVKTCFVAGTKVTMADGTVKNIEDVKIGDKLLSESGFNTVLGYYRPVLGNRHLWSINGGEYFVSDEHPFKTTDGWKSFNPDMTRLEVNLDVTELKVGDIMVTNSGYEKIEKIDYIDSGYNTQLYNFILDGDHTYYANGYLVHNKNGVYQNSYNEGITECLEHGRVWSNYYGGACCAAGYPYFNGSTCVQACGEGPSQDPIDVCYRPGDYYQCYSSKSECESHFGICYMTDQLMSPYTCYCDKPFGIGS